MRLDLHVHTNHSADALHDIKQMILKAKQKFIDAIAITDHNKLFSLTKAKELSKQYKIKIIPGIEIGKLGYINHILALNIDSIPKSRNIHEIIEYVEDEGGITIAPHPFSKIGFKDYERYKFHAVERINGVNWICNRRFKATSKMPQVANSDAHATYMLGYTYTEMEHSESIEQILENIRKGLCKPKGTAIPTYLTMRLALTLSLVKSIQQFLCMKTESFLLEDAFYLKYRGYWSRG